MVNDFSEPHNHQMQRIKHITDGLIAILFSVSLTTIGTIVSIVAGLLTCFLATIRIQDTMEARREKKRNLQHTKPWDD
jgi:hypothetical protein